MLQRSPGRLGTPPFVVTFDKSFHGWSSFNSIPRIKSREFTPGLNSGIKSGRLRRIASFTVWARLKNPALTSFPRDSSIMRMIALPDLLDVGEQNGRNEPIRSTVPTVRINSVRNVKTRIPRRTETSA
jgi:hypothetical protein